MKHISKELARYYQKAKARGDVHSALVVCIAHEDDRPIKMTTNRRGGKRISKWTTHAEEAMIDKLIRMRSYIPSVTFTIVRFRKDGSIGMAKPCARCDKAIRKYGPRKVFYTDDYGKIKALY